MKGKQVGTYLVVGIHRTYESRRISDSDSFHKQPFLLFQKHLGR